MTLEEICAMILAYPGAQEDQPFGPGALVYKVRGKMFALVSDSIPPKVSLKCNPVLATMLRDTYPAVTPGYHLNKQHWNTVLMDHSLPDKLIKEWIVDSYNLVSSKLPRSKKA